MSQQNVEVARRADEVFNPNPALASHRVRARLPLASR